MTKPDQLETSLQLLGVLLIFPWIGDPSDADPCDGNGNGYDDGDGYVYGYGYGYGNGYSNGNSYGNSYGNGYGDGYGYGYGYGDGDGPGHIQKFC